MNLKLLIIEDNEQNMYLMTYLFQSTGCDIYMAYDGAGGVEMAKSLLPDVIILDIELPVMDGYEVATELRKNHELMHVPIIVVTSYAMAGDREKAIEAGASGHLEKPINPDTFIHQVEEIVNNCKIK